MGWRSAAALVASGRALSLVLVLCLTACKSPLAPVSLDEPFVLAPHERAVVEGANLRVEFLEVTGDSRCPIEAMCVWAGDATVHLNLRDAGTNTRYELHTGDPARMTLVHRGFVVHLVGLQPLPSSLRPIAPADYRATFRVTR